MADKTRKIVFTVDVTYREVPPVDFKKGEVKVLRDDLANRWIGRGVATDDAAVIAAAEAAAKAGKVVEIEKPEEKLPEGVPAKWRELHAKEAITLATTVLGAKVNEVQNRAQAMAVIEAAVAGANKPAAAN